VVQPAEDSSPQPDIEQEVRDFYDRYPYPQPIDSLEHYGRRWKSQQKRRADYHLFWPDRSYREDHSILVAGCGTSQAAKHALRWPRAQVTGIDLSAMSVRCTEELKRKHNLTNLQVRQLPIDRLNELEKTFDQIICTGVLHHLQDPDAGLAALRDALEPDGAMHLMVYAPYGRLGIYMLREFCRQIGMRATNEDIEQLIAALRALPPRHPLENVMREAPEFQEAAALADAILHPQDRAYSVPQFLDFIKSGRLTFGRWIKQAPYSPHCGVVSRIPQTTQIAQLPPAEQYSAVEFFRGTIVRHSAVVYRDDRSGGSPAVSFAGDAWLRYKPIRMSETICVQEEVPPGCAAVLINQAHTCKDLLMAIGASEKRLFDAIDGSRTIGDLLETMLPPSQGQSPVDARNFFERLWWHDHVVFDASL
jgi:SAM-dependent methyltransferase